MEILKGSALSKYLLEKYTKNPKGWNFTIGPARRDNFFDALVSGPEESWQLKIDSIFKPNPAVLGTQTDPLAKKSLTLPESFPSYGYRRLDPEIVLKILKEQQDNSDESTRSMDRLMASLEPIAPVPGASYAQGPFVFTNQKFLGLSENQQKLDDRLSSELRSLLREKYLGYG